MRSALLLLSLCGCTLVLVDEPCPVPMPQDTADTGTPGDTGTPVDTGTPDDTGDTGEPVSGLVVAVATGGMHSCAITEESAVTCWGADDQGQASPPALDAVSLTAGFAHTCALDAEGQAHCWGANDSGQSSPPTEVFSEIHAGGRHTCGLTDAGIIACWGSNSAGQTEDPGGPWLAISAGWAHTCGIDTENFVSCWGNGMDALEHPGVQASQITSGQGFACMLPAAEESGPVCWGLDTAGETSPPAIPFVEISAGMAHACGTEAGGDVRCWGDSAAGQLEVPDVKGHGLSSSSSAMHSCVVEGDDAGLPVCWGLDTSGQSSP